ncbi:MAG: hypothetical protein ACRC0A_05680 [Chitinophagaceae bacterium]
MESVNIKKVIEELSQLQRSNIATRVEELLKKLFKDGCGFVIFDLHQGKQIIRSRINTCEKSFSSKCELTYAPPHLNKTYQHARAHPIKLCFMAPLCVIIKSLLEKLN